MGPTAIALALAAVSSSWTGANFGTLNVTDVFLAIAAVFSMLGWLSGRRTMMVQSWMLAPLLGVVIITAVDVIVRSEPVSGGATMLPRLLFSTTLLAILIWSESNRLQGHVWYALRWWAAGVAINASAAALIDGGFLVVDGWIDQPAGDWRASGLAFHPNSLALALTIALPIMVMLLTRSATWAGRVGWIAAIAVTVNALFLADSRAGLIVAFPGLALSILIALRRGRARVFVAPFVIVAGVLAYLYVLPALAGTRLTAESGALSDVGRVQYNATALQIFAEQPLVGGGFDAEIGVAVPLQVLTIGGIVFALCYYTFLLVPGVAIWRNRRDSAAPYGIVYILALLGFGLLNPGLAERVSFWPLLVLAGGFGARRVAASLPAAVGELAEAPGESPRLASRRRRTAF
ncbi:O-antigen ligase family protein [Microbacterium sp. F51-2R]|uniref:O-antigen ligase family protein n=1 Tax=Microbacterium sp. F51-2R TaxID=3445777 RepID=UPI003F9FF017